jgi:hypothetical protein
MRNLTAAELKDIHLALIHRENRIVDTILPITKGHEHETYKAEATRIHALRDKVCKMSLEMELGFSFS